jgi:EAL domain-containing protein (putative c-di-GMP-specific phosphodiesterase class I)
VAALTAGPDQGALVRSILALGATLRLQTVAEGIEDASQLAELRALGAELGQGFYFARPVTGEEIADMATGSGTLLGGQRATPAA